MHLYTLLFSASFYSENTKIYLLSCTHNQNPKTSLPHHIYFIALLFTLLYCISYFIFSYIHNLCLTTTRWSWGHKNEEIVLQVARRRMIRASATYDTKQVCQVETPSAECCSESKFSPRGNSGFISNSRGIVTKALVIPLRAICKTNSLFLCPQLHQVVVKHKVWM
jgi:hypothetical protein